MTGTFSQRRKQVVRRLQGGCSLEDLELIEGFAHVVEGPFPREVLLDHGRGFLTATCRTRSLPASLDSAEGKFLAPENPDFRKSAAIVGTKKDDAGKCLLPQLV